MKTMPRVRRSLAALSVVALLTAAAGCSDEPSGEAEDSADVTPGAEPEETEETEEADPGASEEESGADIPLSDEVSAEDAPAWGLPVVEGWSVPQELQSGVFQISKDGGDALVTAYQLSDPGSSDAEQGASAWLENYHTQIAANPDTSDVSDPTYGTAELESTQGSMEFVLQELTYSTPSGRYHSWSAARWIDGHLFALQYAAPEDEWSADEWTRLNEEGLKLTF